MKYLLLTLTLSILMTSAPLGAQAAYFSEGENPTVSSPVADDSFLAGQRISVTAPIGGEVFAAGNNVSLTERPERSLAAAGNVVTANGAGYNAYLAGSTVVLSGEYGHDVYVAGRTVTIKPGTVIRGDLRIAASDINLDGTIEGDTWVTGEMVVSGATLGGNLSAIVSNITFTGGSIGGDFTYESAEEATGLGQVSIAGQTNRQEARFDDASAGAPGDSFRGWFLKLLSTLLLGAILLLFFRRKTQEIVDVTMDQWKSAWLAGILALILTPLLIILFAVTIIGWPIALILLLAYIIAILLAPVYATLAVGRWLLRRLGDTDASPWSILLVGAVAVAIAKAIPLIGALVWVLFALGLVVPAVGALLLWYRQKAA